MNIYDIESFLRIVQKGNFSKAAESLSLTQPALSQRIKLLEDELGYSLFMRQKGCRALQLTPAGEEFLGIARKMTGLWSEALNIRPDSSAPAILSVSVADSIMTCAMPSISRSFLRDNPEIKLLLNNYHTRDAYRRVEEGELDAAVVGKRFPSTNIYRKAVYTEPWVFICGKDAPYSGVIHPSMLDTRRQLMLCNKEVDDWQEFWFSSSLNSIAGLAKISYMDPDLFEKDLWAVLPLTVAQLLERTAHGQILQIQDGPQPRAVDIIYRKGEKSEIIEKFIACVRREAEKIPGIHLLN